jgi:hypothetical protein
MLIWATSNSARKSPGSAASSTYRLGVAGGVPLGVSLGMSRGGLLVLLDGGVGTVALGGAAGVLVPDDVVELEPLLFDELFLSELSHAASARVLSSAAATKNFLSIDHLHGRVKNTESVRP